jgi:hypothetical protein
MYKRVSYDFFFTCPKEENIIQPYDSIEEVSFAINGHVIEDVQESTPKVIEKWA